MKRLLIALLVVSLAANAWLLLRRPKPIVPTPAPQSAPREPVIQSKLLAGSPATLRDALRAAGTDEATIRALVEGIARRRDYEAQTTAVIEQYRGSWWRVSDSGQRTATADRKRKVDLEVHALLGRDNLDQSDAEIRYSFLPPDKRRQLAQMDLDYAELSTGTRPVIGAAQSPEEAKVEKLLAEERRKDLLALLTPEERAEYELRYGENSQMINRRAAAMGATEAEVRAIKPHVDELQRKLRAQNTETHSLDVFNALQREAAEKIIAAIGYDRAMAYLWSGYESEYKALRRITEASALPTTTPARVMQLSVEIGLAAAAIHEDTALSLPQKQAALVALQQTSQVKLDTLLGQSAQQALGEQPRWLRSLSEGTYYLSSPQVNGAGGGSTTVYKIEQPAGQRRDIPLATLKPPGQSR